MAASDVRGYLPIILPTLHFQHRSNKTENRDQEERIGTCKESQNVHQVLCINMELCTNAGGEVRGDLEDSTVVA
jgi:hypothetical protein